jgi:hypothetical protein
VKLIPGFEDAVNAQFSKYRGRLWARWIRNVILRQGRFVEPTEADLILWLDVFGSRFRGAWKQFCEFAQASGQYVLPLPTPAPRLARPRRPRLVQKNSR